MNTHRLKTWPEFFMSISTEGKNFELRYDDRNFQVGDQLFLEEWNPHNETYTGNVKRRFITYILKDFNGLEKGFAILGLTKDKDAQVCEKAETQTRRKEPVPNAPPKRT